jgi:hypothetical protein
VLADLRKGWTHGEVRVFGGVVVGAVGELWDGAVASVAGGGVSCGYIRCTDGDS